MHLPDGFDPWAVWLALAVGLGLAELLSLDLILLMLAAGAVVGMLAAVLDLPGYAQVLAAVATSLAALALLRPNLIKHLQSGPNLVLGHEALVGRQAVVVEQVSAAGGQVRIGSEIWSARPYDEDLVIRPGARVDVLQIKGATALVHEIPELDP